MAKDKDYSLADFKSTWGDNADSYIHYRYKNWNDAAAATAHFKAKGKKGYQEMRARFIQHSNQALNFNGQDVITLKNLNDVKHLEKSTIEAMRAANNPFKDIRSISLDLNNLRTAASDLAKHFAKNKDLESLDGLLNTLSEAIETIYASNELTALLRSGKEQYGNVNGIIDALANFSGNVRDPKDGTLITVDTMNDLQKYAVYIHNLLQNISSKTNKQNISKTITGSFNNIFGTGLGESLVSAAVCNALKISLDDLTKILSKHSLGTGHNVVVKDSNPGSLQMISGTYKADVGNLSLAVNINGTTATVTMGASVKQYNAKGKQRPHHVSILQGGSIKNLLMSMDEIDKRYLLNALYYLDTDGGKNVYAAFKEAVVKTNADILLSGSGKNGDFAQFIVVNGRWYGMARIIERVADVVGQSHTMGDGGNDILTLSITGAGRIHQLRSQYPESEPPSKSKMQQRMQQLINASLKLSVAAQLHTSQLHALI